MPLPSTTLTPSTLLLPGVAGPTIPATTYYVSAVGNDGNDGLTPSTPWLTVGKVAGSTFNPGDTVLFRGGDTFAGFLYLTTARTGTAASPVVYSSYGVGRATLTNTSTGVFLDATAGLVLQNLMFNGGGNTSDGINCFKGTVGQSTGITITNCDVTGYYNAISIGGSNGGGFATVTITDCDLHGNTADGLKTYGPAYVVGSPAYAHSTVYVGHCRAWNNVGDTTRTAFATGSGINLGSVNGGTVEYCTTWSNGASCQGVKGPVGIWTYDSNNVIIQHCVSYNNSTGSLSTDGDGFDIDINCTACTIQYCLAYGNFGAGIIVFGASNTAQTGNTVRYNLCWGNVRSAVVYHAELKIGGGVLNCAIYNNTLVAMDNTATTHPPAVSIEDTGAQGVTFRNNILYQLGTGAVLSTPAALTSANALFQGNIYYRPTGLSILWNGVTYTSLVTWRSTVTNQEMVAGIATGSTINPLLVNPTSTPTVTDPAFLSGAAGLKLQSISTASTTGLDLATLFTAATGVLDYFGGPLIAPYSIGAHELNSIIFAIATQPPIMPWEFVIGPASGGHSLALTAAKNRKLTARLTAPSEASFDIDGRHPQATAIAELATDLHVLYTQPTGLTTILYRGRIGATSDALDGTGHTVSVSSLDYREILKRRILYNGDTLTYTATDQADIVWQLIRQTQLKTGGDLSISIGIGNPTGTLRTLTYAAGDSIGDRIQELSQMAGGFDWDVMPISSSALALNLWCTIRGLYQSVVLEYGGLVESVRREVRPTDYANAVRVTGDQTQTTPPTPQERTAIDIATVAQGRWDKALPAPGALTLAALTSMADGTLAYSAALIPAYVLTLRRGAWQGPGHIWLGDTVTVVVRSGRLAVTGTLLRVQEIGIDIAADGTEQVTVTVGRPPLNYSRLPSQMDQRLRDVERR